MPALLFLLLIAFSAGAQQRLAAPSLADDVDGDGLSDTLEQALLERFLPRFFVSRLDCDQAPSTFAPGEAEPRSTGRHGTIYGQAFPAPGGLPSQTDAVQRTGPERIEMHYYHLWSKDCGRFSHPLDVEHVAVLLERRSTHSKSIDNTSIEPAPPPLWEWKALYWFAAGHQNTVCDVSHAAQASALVAEWMGADVWISSGKHASYLSRERCRFGCGGDSCPQMQALPVAAVVNVGERGKPMNGAVWIASGQWPMLAKMGPYFNASVTYQIDNGGSDRIVSVNRALPPVRATILAGEHTIQGVATGGKHTGGGLKTGRDSTGNALGKAFRAVKKALGASDD